MSTGTTGSTSTSPSPIPVGRGHSWCTLMGSGSARPSMCPGPAGEASCESRRGGTAKCIPSRISGLGVGIGLHCYPHKTPHSDSWRRRRPDVHDKHPVIGQERPIPTRAHAYASRAALHSSPHCSACFFYFSIDIPDLRIGAVALHSAAPPTDVPGSDSAPPPPLRNCIL